MSGQPEFIWARLDNATLYADGSSPCVARTKEFANGTKYVRADASSQAEIERLRTALGALLKQALQSELNTPAHEWGWEAIQGAIAVLPDFAALSGSKE